MEKKEETEKRYPISADIDLVNEYENLRHFVLEASPEIANNCNRNGLFLLIHKGMTCWMESWQNYKAEIGNISQENSVPKGDPEIKAQQPKLELITMIADIMLANRREVK